ncbi:MAG: MlaD family protein [Planctomycetota bacterium]
MDESVLRFRVGIFVLIALVILGFLIFLNSEGFGRRYTIYIKPPSAPGVTSGTPVRKNGILIGRVSTVATEDDHVVLGIRINEKERIYANETLSIGADSFLGDAAIEVLPLPRDERGEQVVHNDVLTSFAVKRNPMEIVDVALDLENEIKDTLDAVQQAGAAVSSAGQGINDLSNTVQSAFQDEESDIKELISDFRSMSQKAETALTNFNQVFENVNSVLGDPEMRGKFDTAFGELQKIFEEVRVTVADTRTTINSYREISARAGRNLENLETFTGALRDEGPEILIKVNEKLDNVDGMLDQLGTFADTLSQTAENLSNSDGTVGRLLNESDLYDSALATVQNAQLTMQRVQDVSIKLEPLVNDLRLFADSLARDPGQLGVRGALDRRPQGTGYKGSAGREGNSIFR